jgi:hypothetical protein
MKTKIASLFIICFFFLSVSTFADNDTPRKTKALPDCGCEDPIIDDDGNIIDYIRPPWWIGPSESLPDRS